MATGSTGSASMDIHIPVVGQPLCIITSGAAKRITRSTTHLVGAALLSSAISQEGSGSVNTDMRWQDHLATHGIAIGQRGLLTATLAVIPVRERIVPVMRVTDRTQMITLTFPQLLVGILQKDGAFVRGVFYVVNPTGIASLSILSPARVLSPFPYGNIHPNGQICWGTIVHAGIASLTGLLDLFFESGFNGDLITPAAFGMRDANLSAIATALGPRGGVLPLPTAFGMSVTDAVGSLLRSS